MLRLPSSSTPSPDAPTAPAMALLETLIAAAILAAALTGFWSVLREARADLTRARANEQASALAASVLQEARSTWRTGPYSGERADYVWRLSCAPSRAAQSQRLVIVACTARIEKPGLAPMRYQAAWIEPRAGLLRR